MKLPKKCIATKVLLLLALLPAAPLAFAAQVAGTVTHLSGPLLDKKPDGTVKALAQKSTVEQGDTLISEKDTYARIKFIDNSEITLRPNTQFKIDNFSFDEARPEADSAAFSLIKGGLRAVTGVLGKRNHERFGLNTPTATIGIRGTIFIAEYIPVDEDKVAAFAQASVATLAFGGAGLARTATDTPLPGAIVPLRIAQVPGMPADTGSGRAPGLYVHVLDGMINLSNNGGSQNFAAGQFGYTASITQLPVVLPANPGIRFTPPPAFSSANGPSSGAPGSNKGSGDVDCEVR